MAGHERVPQMVILASGKRLGEHVVFSHCHRPCETGKPTPQRTERRGV